MKVDNPRFDEEGVDCPQCPFNSDKTTPSRLCYDWHVSHDFECPLNSREYAEACRLAEQANKGEE